MKLEVHHNGVKLFFITCAVAGRRQLLSQLVDEGTRPQLLPLGEIAQAAILAVHQVWPAVGTSDFVIMPDHFHFLMVVDYLRFPGFNPLWATHRLLDAIELAWNERGQAPEPPSPPNMVGALRTAVARGRAIAMLRKHGTTALPAAPPAAAGFGAASPVRRMLFERSPWLDLAFDPRQLHAIRLYIRLNPARALWKQRHRDLFVCHRGIKAARLARFGMRRFDGIGNLSLLASPFLFHVRLTLKKTVAEHRPAIEEILEKARRGWVPVSGFISPGEKEALRRLKAEPRVRFIRLLPWTLPDRYDPSAEDSREIAGGRLAILSPFSATAVISTRDITQQAAAAHAFRANCLLMNEIGAQLCAIN